MSKSKGVSLQLKDRQIEQLDRLAQREGRTRAEMASMLLERVLRLGEFPNLVLRDFGAGPEVFISGSRLRAWWVATLVRDYEGDTAKAAEHVNLPEDVMKEVQRYATLFPEEIEAAIEQNDRDHEAVERWLASREVATPGLTPANAPAP